MQTDAPQTPTKTQRMLVAPHTPPNQRIKAHNTMAPTKMLKLTKEQREEVKIKLFLTDPTIGEREQTFDHDVTYTLIFPGKMRWTAGSFDAPAGQNDVVITSLQGNVDKTKAKICYLIQLADSEIGHGIRITVTDNAAVNQLVNEDVLYRLRDCAYSKHQPRAETAQELNRRCVWLSLKVMNQEIQLEEYERRYPELQADETLHNPNQYTEQELAEREVMFTQLINDKKRFNRYANMMYRTQREHEEFDTDSRRKTPLRRTKSISAINRS